MSTVASCNERDLVAEHDRLDSGPEDQPDALSAGEQHGVPGELAVRRIGLGATDANAPDLAANQQHTPTAMAQYGMKSHVKPDVTNVRIRPIASAAPKGLTVTAMITATIDTGGRTLMTVRSRGGMVCPRKRGSSPPRRDQRQAGGASSAWPTPWNPVQGLRQGLMARRPGFLSGTRGLTSE